MKNREPWNFCETPKEKCTMNYCDDNGCQNRKRNYVEGNDLIADVSQQRELLIDFFIKQHQSTKKFNELVEPENIVDEYLKGNL